MENEVKRSPNYISNFHFKWVRTQKNHGNTFFTLWESEVKGNDFLYKLFYPLKLILIKDLY